MLAQGINMLIDGSDRVKPLTLSGGYFGQLPQNSPLPAWTFNFLSPVRNYTLQGRNPLTKIRLQIDCYGNTAAEAVLLANAIDSVLDLYKGRLPDEDSTSVSLITQSNLIDFFDSAVRDQRRMLEYEVHFIEITK